MNNQHHCCAASFGGHTPDCKNHPDQKATPKAKPGPVEKTGWLKNQRVRFFSLEEEARISHLTPRQRVVILLDAVVKMEAEPAADEEFRTVGAMVAQE